MHIGSCAYLYAARYLASQAEEAYKHSGRTKELFEAFEATIPGEKIVAWKEKYPSEKGEVIEEQVHSRYCTDASISESPT